MSKFSDFLRKEKPVFVSKYVGVSIKAINYLIIPLTKFMEHLIEVKGLDPKAAPKKQNDVNDVNDVFVDDAALHEMRNIKIERHLKPICHQFGKTFFPVAPHERTGNEIMTIKIPRVGGKKTTPDADTFLAIDEFANERLNIESDDMPPDVLEAVKVFTNLANRMKSDGKI